MIILMRNIIATTNRDTQTSKLKQLERKKQIPPPPPHPTPTPPELKSQKMELSVFTEKQ